MRQNLCADFERSKLATAEVMEPTMPENTNPPTARARRRRRLAVDVSTRAACVQHSCGGSHGRSHGRSHGSKHAHCLVREKWRLPGKV